MTSSITTNIASSLAIEYRQKQFCSLLVDKFLQFSEVPRAKGPASRQEAANIIDRWLLSLQQDCERSIDQQLPLLPELSADDPLMKQLATDAYDKGFCLLKRSATNLSARVAKEIEKFRHRCHNSEAAEEPEVQLEMMEDGRGRICVGEFRSRHSYRLPYLVRKFGLEPTAAMLLRYESLGCGSYQWGDPLTVHQLYYDQFAARYEGFASPLNSRFLGMDGARFCSLFKDTDTIFGSLGNFFSVNLADYQGGWSVNPPFIESVLEMAAKKVLDCLSDGCNSWFFMNFPDWRDSPGWHLLNNSSFKSHRFDFAPGEFLIQDSYGSCSRPKMKLSIFVIGRLPKEAGAPELIADAVFKARPPADRAGDCADDEMLIMRHF